LNPENAPTVPSTENAAAVAGGNKIGTMVGVTLLHDLQMITRLGASVVSERIAVCPSGDTARTRPAVPLNCDAEVPLNVIRPCVPNPWL